jgi:hypothetical protein
VAGDLGEQERQADISILFNLGASKTPTNIARDKDKLVGEAVEALHRTKRARRLRRR